MQVCQHGVGEHQAPEFELSCFLYMFIDEAGLDFPIALVLCNALIRYMPEMHGNIVQIRNVNISGMPRIIRKKLISDSSTNPDKTISSYMYVYS